MADVNLANVVKRFGSTEVIHGVSFDIIDKEFVVFVGPSGCGKSTLLRLIAGLEDLTEGDIYINGDLVNELPPARRGIAMVFQSYALYPHMSVYQNMAFGLKLAKKDKATIDRAVQQAAEILQITPLLKRKPKQLSGGQRQRVAIGRAIVRDPTVFLFDEPLSNLDAKLRVQMRIEIAKLHRDLGATMIYVTHDQVEAMTMADRIVVLRDGYIEQIGTPLDLYRHPENLFVAQFIGSPSMNVFEAAVKGYADGGVEVVLPGGNTIKVPTKMAIRAGETVTFGARPEHINAEGEGEATIPGEVFVVEQLGGATYIYVTIEGGHTVTVLADGESAIREGENIEIGIPLSACHVFNPEGKSITAYERQSLAA